MAEPLPADPDNQNDDRARWAGAALEAFQKTTRCSEVEALVDLLCDLMHWCDRHGADFREALNQAKGHYQEETYRGG